MTPEEYKWTIDLVQQRYQYLNLTYEQAEKIYKYEQDRDTFSDEHFFTVWEESDYELTAFREILNGEQLKNHETFLNESIRGYEKSLVDQDNEKTNDNAHLLELINFYETQFLPDIYKDPFLRFGWLSRDIAKIQYLRTEYKRFLDKTKKSILTNHFRHNRTFRPNELKTSLLQHKLSCIFPDYFSFKQQMDEPTRAVSAYLTAKILNLPDETEKLLTRKFNELKDFNESNSRKYYNNIGGWHVVTDPLTPQEEREYRNMALLLLDRSDTAADNSMKFE